MSNNVINFTIDFRNERGLNDFYINFYSEEYDESRLLNQINNFVKHLPRFNIDVEYKNTESGKSILMTVNHYDSLAVIDMGNLFKEKLATNFMDYFDIHTHPVCFRIQKYRNVDSEVIKRYHHYIECAIDHTRVNYPKGITCLDNVHITVGEASNSEDVLGYYYYSGGITLVSDKYFDENYTVLDRQANTREVKGISWHYRRIDYKLDHFDIEEIADYYQYLSEYYKSKGYLATTFIAGIEIKSNVFYQLPKGHVSITDINQSIASVVGTRLNYIYFVEKDPKVRDPLKAMKQIAFIALDEMYYQAMVAKIFDIFNAVNPDDDGILQRPTYLLDIAGYKHYGTLVEIQSTQYLAYEKFIEALRKAYHEFQFINLTY